MTSQPTSGYYQFSVAVTGDSRLIANHVEVRGLENLSILFLSRKLSNSKHRFHLLKNIQVQ